MTSPVDFISGPSTASSPGNRPNGSTGFLTLTNGPTSTLGGAMSARRSPAMTRAAMPRRADSPTALLTNGTVREARGLASSTNTWSLRTANWMFEQARARRSALRDARGHVADLG